jgi:hypothetical protein
MPCNSSATRVEIERTNLTEHSQRYRLMYASEILAERVDAIQSLMRAGRCSPGASPAGSRCGVGARQAPICNSTLRRALA